jgi:hypothetical protein
MSDDTDRINAVIDRINAHAESEDWVALDRFVRGFPITATALELMALLRSTYALRERLPSWQDRLAEIHTVVDKLHPKLLQGLD